MITGYDVAGTVHSCGSAVKNYSVGDAVFGDILAESVGPKYSGSIAEYCVCNEDLLAPMPTGFSFQQCAAMPLASQTAFQSFDVAGLKQGHKLFVSGGAGGVGVHAMQIAKAVYGVAEIATTASAGKTDFVKRYGADRVVDYKTQDAGEVLKGWADVALDLTNEIEMGNKVVKEGGELVSIVAYGAPDVNFVMLAPSGDMMGRTARAMESGGLVPVIDTVYEFKDSLKAVEHIAGGRAKGKIVINVRD